MQLHQQIDDNAAERRGDETTATGEKTSRKIFGFLDNKSLKFGLWRPLLF